jgi:hypothetical protein
MTNGVERWMVFDSGRRCRVSIWPGVPTTGAPADEPRFLVFDTGKHRRCVRVTARLEISRLSGEDLLRLYRRAEPIPALEPV